MSISDELFTIRDNRYYDYSEHNDLDGWSESYHDSGNDNGSFMSVCYSHVITYLPDVNTIPKNVIDALKNSVEPKDVIRLEYINSQYERLTLASKLNCYANISDILRRVYVDSINKRINNCKTVNDLKLLHYKHIVNTKRVLDGNRTVILFKRYGYNDCVITFEGNKKKIVKSLPIKDIKILTR